MSFAHRDVRITDGHDSGVAVRGEAEQLTLLWHEQVEEAFQSCAAKPRPRRAPAAAPMRGPGAPPGPPPTGGARDPAPALIGARR
jgi:hypothetical protein